MKTKMGELATPVNVEAPVNKKIEDMKTKIAEKKGEIKEDTAALKSLKSKLAKGKGSESTSERIRFSSSVWIILDTLNN